MSILKTCSICKNKYLHAKFVNVVSGGVMKTTGNSYCTALKKHKKLKKTEIYKKSPVWCPLEILEDSKNIKVEGGKA